MLEKKYPDQFICFTHWSGWEHNWGLLVIHELLAEFDPQEVTFVYFAHHTPKGRWLEELSQSNYAGDHYLLSEQQFQSIDSLFRYRDRRYPHLLMNADGEVLRERPWYVGKRLKEYIRKSL